MPFPTQCMKCRQETINEEREKYYKAIFEKEEKKDDIQVNSSESIYYNYF